MNQEDSTAEIIRDSRASQLQSCRQRIALFKGLQVDNYEDRASALEKIIQVVKSYIRSSLSPITTSPTLSDHSVTDHTIQCEDDEYSKQLFYFLLTILRLSISCPYSDVRQTFKHLLIGLKETTTIAIPQPKYKSPSYFIPLFDIFSLESNNSSFQQAAVLYPRSSSLSFSPWSSNNSIIDEPLTKGSEEDDPSMPTDHTKPKNTTTTTTTTMATTTSKQPSSISSATSITSTNTPDFTGGRPSDEYVRQMMIKTFTDEGRLANLFRVLSFFPTFFEIYHVTFSKIMKGTMGPLHRTWKAYIGLMVAAEQKCQYLFSSSKIEFLYNGGDPNWLRGLDYVPHKLRKISVLTLKLARQPWKLDTEDIQMLLSGGIGDAWSKGELVQATLIIATFLGLSSFILGCGITPEIDMTGGFYLPRDQHAEGIENELDLPILESLSNNGGTSWQQQQQQQQQKEDQYFSSDHGIGLGVSTIEVQDDLNHTEQLIHKLKSKKNCGVKEQLLESLEKIKIHDGNKMMTINTNFNSEEKKVVITEGNKIYDDLELFVDADQAAIEHQIFDVENDTEMEFMLGEYCWEDHGCDLANHYLPGIGDDLVQEFTEAISITDWSIFHPVVEDVVDTSPLRYAIWYYTQKIMGVTKEDYTYADIPTYLNDRTTKYIQTLCMSPSKIQKNDWCNIGISLRPEEKCHVNLLVASARKQAVLCYGLCLISEV